MVHKRRQRIVVWTVPLFEKYLYNNASKYNRKNISVIFLHILKYKFVECNSGKYRTRAIANYNVELSLHREITSLSVDIVNIFALQIIIFQTIVCTNIVDVNRGSVGYLFAREQPTSPLGTSYYTVFEESRRS